MSAGTPAAPLQAICQDVKNEQRICNMWLCIIAGQGSWSVGRLRAAEAALDGKPLSAGTLAAALRAARQELSAGDAHLMVLQLAEGMLLNVLAPLVPNVSMRVTVVFLCIIASEGGAQAMIATSYMNSAHSRALKLAGLGSSTRKLAAQQHKSF